MNGGGTLNTTQIYTENRLSGRTNRNYFLYAFLFGLGLAAVIFLPFIIRDGGRFIFYGDFNVQQIPFYRIAHDAVRSGNLGWDHLTDLGVNFIGSYSFYLLGSPFFWLTIPFPGEWLQYLMGPLLVLKFGCASLTGYVYLHRYAKNPNTALIGALLYAFSGFSVYNIFFNHFHESLIVFPLLLSALDEYMYSGKRGVFAGMVALCCVTNYYFFVGMVTFTVIYFFVRLFTGSWKISFKNFVFLAVEAVLGLGIACFLLTPSIMCIMQNYRVTNPISGWNALLYGSNQRYIHILQSFFFLPDLPARPNFAPESNSKWSSLGAWLPMFSMVGVIGWLQIHRRHWLKRLLWVLFIMAFIPGLNASFQLMNASYYARWFYMLTLMMALATMMSLENARVDWLRALKWTSVITVVLGLVIGLMPDLVEEDGKITGVNFGLEQYPTRLWSYIAAALVCLALVAFLITFYIRNSKAFYRAALVCLSLVITGSSIYFIALGKVQSTDPYSHLIPYALNGGENVQIDDLRDDRVRTDFYESLDNSAMFWKVQSIQAFHSVVPGSLMEFYDTIGVERDVASRPDTTHYGLRALTSTKYLFDCDHDEKFFAGEDYSKPIMPGWAYYSNANGFDIYENTYYIPLGFTYENYVTQEQYDNIQEQYRELLLLKGILLSDEQIKKWGDMLAPLKTEDILCTDQRYVTDCAARASLTCSSFMYTNSGFNATISTDHDVPVFFSIPYEAGWTAYVNGSPVEIERVNVGFMAVRVHAGENIKISFVYRTPGLLLGTGITVVSVLLLLLYLFITRVMDRVKHTEKPVRHNMRLQPLSHYAQKHRASFSAHTLIPIKSNLVIDEELEKKEGFTDDR